MKVSEFFETDYVDFASYDNLRKIASYIDGQKNAARKVLCTIIDKNIKDEIKVSQLSSKSAEYCLTGDTLINTVEFGLISIKELVDKNLEFFDIYCIDNSGNKTIGKGKHARFMKLVSELIEIQTETETIKCTPEHKILVNPNNPVWKEAKDLTEDDFIVNI